MADFEPTPGSRAGRGVKALKKLAGSSPSTVGPTRQIFTSGSGTYTTPAGVAWIEVELVGGAAGGGGGSGSNGDQGKGTAGNDTTFGTTFLKGGGAAINVNYHTAGTGGTATGGDINIPGSLGQPGQESFAAVAIGIGGNGGATPFSGSGSGNSSGATGATASANSGSGGAGGGAFVTSASSNGNSGVGGSAGGYVRKLIVTPSATYAYVVGAGGTGGAGATGVDTGAAGGAGAAGFIIVTEHYNH